MCNFTSSHQRLLHFDHHNNLLYRVFIICKLKSEWGKRNNGINVHARDIIGKPLEFRVSYVELHRLTYYSGPIKYKETFTVTVL